VDRGVRESEGRGRGRGREKLEIHSFMPAAMECCLYSSLAFPESPIIFDGVLMDLIL
jgi:hypothetical protein